MLGRCLGSLTEGIWDMFGKLFGVCWDDLFKGFGRRLEESRPLIDLMNSYIKQVIKRSFPWDGL